MPNKSSNNIFKQSLESKIGGDIMKIRSSDSSDKMSECSSSSKSKHSISSSGVSKVFNNNVSITTYEPKI
jgi:hypothetical protein